MSRGLGKLQREILETLEEAKASGIVYRGVSWYKYDIDALGRLAGAQPGWVVAQGCEVLLAPHVYDLRASMKHLAKHHGALEQGQWVTRSFAASFSRAVRSLVKRGYLDVLWPVPIQAALEGGDEWRLMYLADGTYLKPGNRQRRFVSVNHI